MAYYENTYVQQIETPLMRTVRSPAGVGTAPPHLRMLLILCFVLFVILPLFMFLSRNTGLSGPVDDVAAAGDGQVDANFANEAGGGGPVTGSGQPETQFTAGPAPNRQGSISPVFTPEVQHWAPQIVQWAAQFDLDPNLAAVIMQIESCGDPGAVSSAGAQGLFQVMPFHFTAGENTLDPDTNARRGLNYFVERLQQTNGDVGKAFAGYNGGQRAAAGSWNTWPAETQRYFTWATGIYDDIQSGASESPTIQTWLNAGGAALCNQAARRIGLR